MLASSASSSASLRTFASTRPLTSSSTEPWQKRSRMWRTARAARLRGLPRRDRCTRDPRPRVARSLLLETAQHGADSDLLEVALPRHRLMHGLHRAGALAPDGLHHLVFEVAERGTGAPGWKSLHMLHVVTVHDVTCQGSANGAPCQRAGARSTLRWRLQDASSPREGRRPPVTVALQSHTDLSSAHDADTGAC